MEEPFQFAELSRVRPVVSLRGRTYACCTDPDRGRPAERPHLKGRSSSQPDSCGLDRSGLRGYRGLGVFPLSRGMAAVRLVDRLIAAVWSCVLEGLHQLSLVKAQKPDYVVPR